MDNVEFNNNEEDNELLEDSLQEDCPKCGRVYDHIDFDFQSCSKCGWDSSNNKYDEELKREPDDDDFMNGDADFLTGAWI